MGNSEQTKIMQVQRAIAAVSSCLAVFFAGGIIFGFASLQSVLAERGVFSSLCNSTSVSSFASASVSTCPEQLSRLDLLFSISVSALYLFVVPFGFVIDGLGARFSMLIGCALVAVASVLLATLSHIDAVYYFAIPAYGCASPAVFMSALVLPKAFGAQWSHVVTTLIICSFDTASAVFLLFKVAFENGVSALPIFVAHAVVVGVVGIVSFVSLPTVAQVTAMEQQYRKKDDLLSLVDSSDEGSSLLHTSSPPPSPTAQVSVWNGLKKPTFWLAMSFIAVWSMKNALYIAIFEEQWKAMIDAPSVETALLAFSIAMPVGGIVAVPLTMLIFRFCNEAGMFFVVWLFGMIYSALNMVPHVEAAYAGVAFYVLLRPLKWATTSEWVIKNFESYNLGRLFAVLNLVVGLVTLLQYAGAAAINALHSYYIVLALATGIALLTGIFPLVLALRKKE